MSEKGDDFTLTPTEPATSRALTETLTIGEDMTHREMLMQLEKLARIANRMASNILYCSSTNGMGAGNQAVSALINCAAQADIAFNIMRQMVEQMNARFMSGPGVPQRIGRA